MGEIFVMSIMAVSYSHDIATALLAASAVTLWILSRVYPSIKDRQTAENFIDAYHSVTKIAKYSLYYILIAGVPRIIYYNEFEWLDSLGNLQVGAIIVKHIVMFCLVGMGLWHWRRLGRKVQELKTTQA